ncbi:MAG: hypothetical protein ACI8SA_000186 [Dokdonia sp.]|jgi:hypothetical protein
MEILIILIILIGSPITIYFAVKKLKSGYTDTQLKPWDGEQEFKPKALIIDTETTGLILDNSVSATKKMLPNFHKTSLELFSYVLF